MEILTQFPNPCLYRTFNDLRGLIVMTRRAGLLTSRKLPGRAAVHYRYDKAGCLVAAEFTPSGEGSTEDYSMVYAYDANGNVTLDESRGITDISYNDANQATDIWLSDGCRVVTSYGPDGTKLRSALASPEGWGVTVRKYLGNLVIEDDRVVQQLFPGGYFDADGNAFYYLTDYQGNVTGVIDSNAKIVQETGYYPYGEPWLEPDGDNPYLYGGKERMALGGVRYSDFGPRLLSTASGYWGSPDPLCEDFRDLSPYINCAANPVRYTDPTGMVICDTCLNAEQKKEYNATLEILRSSQLFNTVYKALDDSENIYCIKYGNIEENGLFDESTNTISFKIKGEDEGLSKYQVAGFTFAEEFFHAYQTQNKSEYDQGEFNREFEAKVFTAFVNCETVTGANQDQGFTDFYGRIQDGIYGDHLSPATSRTAGDLIFKHDYMQYADTYAVFQTNNNGNSYHRMRTTVLPAVLLKVISETYNK